MEELTVFDRNPRFAVPLPVPPSPPSEPATTNDAAQPAAEEVAGNPASTTDAAAATSSTASGSREQAPLQQPREPDEAELMELKKKKLAELLKEQQQLERGVLHNAIAV